MRLPFSFALFALAGFLAAGSARAETYTIDPVQSSVAFTARLLGHAVRGTFAKFSGTITADPAHPEKMTAAASIEAASIDTKIEQRNHHLHSADYFNVARFPSLTFHSRSVQPGAGGDFDVTGDLTIKDVTKSVVLHVHPAAGAGGPPRWEAKTQVNRRDFGVAASTLSDRGIANTVDVILEIQARQP